MSEEDIGDIVPGTILYTLDVDPLEPDVVARDLTLADFSRWVVVEFSYGGLGVASLMVDSDGAISVRNDYTPGERCHYFETLREALVEELEFHRRIRDSYAKSVVWLEQQLKLMDQRKESDAPDKQDT